MKKKTKKILSQPESPLPLPSSSLAEIFHENTKIRKFDIEFFESRDDHVKQLLMNQYLRFLSWRTQLSNTQRNTGNLTVYTLPRKKELKKETLNLLKIIKKRRSIREFSGENITLPQLSVLLQAYAAMPKKNDKLGLKLRNTPSAGALYPIEIYMTIMRDINSKLSAGIYSYNPLNHSLIQLASSSGSEKINEFLAPQAETNFQKSAVIFYIVGSLKRCSWKYGNRAYSYMLIEAGHLAQNILLLGTTMNLSACPVVGFICDEVSNYLGISEPEEMVLYILVVGKGAKSGN